MSEILGNIKQIVIASGNKDKIKQIKSFKFFEKITLLTAEDVGLGEIEETEDTLEGNALLKARHCFNITGLPSLSDDTGFFVNALGGFPGMHCGRLAGPTGNRDFHMAAQMINEKLGDSQDRSSIFSSAIAFIAKGIECTANGSMPGTFVYPAMNGNCNNNGGYNPYFIPENSVSHTYAQIGVENVVNHRFIALQALVKKLSTISNTHNR